MACTTSVIGLTSIRLVSPACPLAVSGLSGWRGGTVLLVICRKICVSGVKRSVLPLQSRNPPGFQVFISLLSLLAGFSRNGDLTGASLTGCTALLLTVHGNKARRVTRVPSG